jgi:serine/threonine-protein kinase
LIASWDLFQPQQRAHSSRLAARLTSDLIKIIFLTGEAFPLLAAQKLQSALFDLFLSFAINLLNLLGYSDKLIRQNPLGDPVKYSQSSWAHTTMKELKSIPAEKYIGLHVGTSTILRELGRGSMAIVFEAYQRTLKRKIAVKILPKSLLTPNSAERFQQEAEAAAVLSHPNIIPVYEVGETADFLFMSMQWIHGRDLLYYVKKSKKNVIPSKRVLPLKASLHIVTSVLEALEYAHGQGVVHRDIKPPNILMENHTKRPLVSDFGTARFIKGEELGEEFILGTPLYMAPEQISKTDVDGRADIYAVGVMLFQMLVEKLPMPQFPSMVSLLKHKQKETGGIFSKRPSELNPALNSDFDRIIGKALRYEPEERFQNCTEFMKALKTYRRRYLQAA